MDNDLGIPFLTGEGDTLEQLSLGFFALCKEVKSDRDLVAAAVKALAKQPSCDHQKLHQDFVVSVEELFKGKTVPPRAHELAMMILSQKGH